MPTDFSAGQETRSLLLLQKCCNIPIEMLQEA